ncbi:MAG: ACT domain-containing protein [Erythrobacter sp.]
MSAGAPVGDLAQMLAGMAPVLHEQAFAFALLDEGDALPAEAFALVREEEGTTAILPADTAGPRFARITLSLHSALEGVGLTAAVSSLLAEKGIACNVVAGFHHDHLFVPWERRVEALGLLEGLAASVLAARDAE